MISIIDTETTGLGANCEICEIAWINLVLEGVGYHYSSLCSIKGLMGAEAEMVHGISVSHLEGRPLAKDVLRASWKHPEFLVAHNAPFDLKFLTPLFLELGFPGFEVVDTLKCARRLYPGLPSYSLYNLVNSLNLPFPDEDLGLLPHRALYDAFTTYRLLTHMLQSHSIEKLAEITQKGRRDFIKL